MAAAAAAAHDKQLRFDGSICGIWSARMALRMFDELFEIIVYVQAFSIKILHLNLTCTHWHLPWYLRLLH